MLKNILLSLLLLILFFNPLFYKVIEDEINNYFSNQPELSRYLISNLNENEKVLLINMSEMFSPFLTDFPTKDIDYLDCDIEIVNNNFLDEYINKNNINIKYIAIPDRIIQNLKYPYIKVFKSPKNQVTSVEIVQPYVNDYTIYMKTIPF